MFATVLSGLLSLTTGLVVYSLVFLGTLLIRVAAAEASGRRKP